MSLLLALALTTSAEQPYSFASTPGKLPKNIVPRHYAIRIEPDLEKFTTRGTVTVDLDVLSPAKEIILNARDMEVTKATLLGPPELALKPRLDLGKQTVSLKLPKTLPPGQYRLALEFFGQITEQAQGLFYVKYAAPSGKKVMLGTQMEPADARRMFPCWDEPAFRATFSLTTILPEKLASSLSDARRKIAAGDSVRINGELLPKNGAETMRDKTEVDANTGAFIVQFGRKKIVLVKPV